MATEECNTSAISVATIRLTSSQACSFTNCMAEPIQMDGAQPYLLYNKETTATINVLIPMGHDLKLYMMIALYEIYLQIHIIF